MAPTTRRLMGCTVAVVCALGCGGLRPTAASDIQQEVEVPPLTGHWCMTDAPYCYLFEGDKVMEDLGPEMQEWGRFAVEEDLLILTWSNPHEVMTWQILRQTPSILVLVNLRDDDRFTMAAVESFPPEPQRPQ